MEDWEKALEELLLENCCEQSLDRAALLKDVFDSLDWMELSFGVADEIGRGDVGDKEWAALYGSGTVGDLFDFVRARR